MFKYHCIFISIILNAHCYHSTWCNSVVLIPAYLSAISILVLILRGVILHSKSVKALYVRLWTVSHNTVPESSPSEQWQATRTTPFSMQVQEYVLAHGGATILAYKVARLVGCLSLLGLSVATSIMRKCQAKTLECTTEGLFTNQWLQISFCLILVRIVARKRSLSNVVQTHYRHTHPY